MNTLSLNTLNVWADLWLEALWRASWQGGLAISLVWAVTRLWPRMSPRVRGWLWTLAYLKLFASFLWTTPIELPLLSESPTAHMAAYPAPRAGDPSFPFPSFDHRSLPPVQRSSQGRTSIHISCIALGVWLLGLVSVIHALLRERLAARYLRRRCAAVNSP